MEMTNYVQFTKNDSGREIETTIQTLNRHNIRIQIIMTIITIMLLFMNVMLLIFMLEMKHAFETIEHTVNNFIDSDMINFLNYMQKNFTLRVHIEI